MEKMDLGDLTNDEIGCLAELIRACIGNNRILADLNSIIQREMMRRGITDAKDYQDAELADAINQLSNIIDTLRDQGVSDTHPVSMFLLLALGAILGEHEARLQGMTLQ